MDARAFRDTLTAHGIDREVGDAIMDLVEDRRADLVTEQKLELEMSKLRGELKTEMANLRTDFADHKTDMTRLVLGTSGVIGLLIVAMRFIPVA